MSVALSASIGVVTGNATTLVTNYTDGAACLPMTMPSANTVLNSPKKIFAHYLLTFPESIDNAVPATDYYNRNYLSRTGEHDKFITEGGYIRQRPLGVGPGPNATWLVGNMESEVRNAIARGITGFTFDVMSAGEATEATGAVQRMLTAAHAVDSRFKIIIMPDLTTLGSDSSAVIAIIKAVANNPAAYHLSNGELVVSAFDAGINSASWWASIIKQLSNDGIKVAFVPTFLGWNEYAASFSSFSYGFGDWGTSTVSAAVSIQPDPETVHSVYKKSVYMMPVNGQQYRPKDFMYYEAGNSETFRDGWMSAIQGDTDWVQLVTWNDFSESSEIQPYTDSTLKTYIGTGYYDLNGYYASWFLTGQEPTITHDVLYYFYRKEPPNATGTGQVKKDAADASTPQNNIELVAFLTSPGVLKIKIGAVTYSKNASAGITSFKVPASPGTPTFALWRSGADVFYFSGGVQIYGSGGLPSGVEDLTYWSGSASKTGICAL